MNVLNIRKLGHENSRWKKSGFHFQKLYNSHKTIKMLYLKKYTVLHDASISKLVLE